MNLPPHFFVVGTDTGIGKTFVSIKLMLYLAKQCKKVVGMKPIASGVITINGQPMNEDAWQLCQAANVTTPYHLINPILLPEAVSPNFTGEPITEKEFIKIKNSFVQLTNLADSVVIEGVGGFLVPLSKTKTGADLCQLLDLPLILVVGIQLGCLNHALLTVEAIKSRALNLSGWIANIIEKDMPKQNDNIAYLQRHIPAELLATFPYQENKP